MPFRAGRTTPEKVRPAVSFTPNEQPLAGELRPGELAVNANDGMLFIGKDGGSVASLPSLVDGKIPASQLPSYVDDVEEYANLAAFPEPGETSKIYVAIDTAKTYRWSGSIYVEVSSGEPPAPVNAGEVSGTYATNASDGDIFDLTLGGNLTLANPTNPANGKTIRWRIRQDATGGRTVTLGNKFVIPSSATSPLPFSTAANAMDILAATYHAGRDKWDVIAFVPGY